MGCKVKKKFNMAANKQVERGYQELIPIFIAYMLNTNYSRIRNRNYLYIFSKFTLYFTFLVKFNGV